MSWGRIGLSAAAVLVVVLYAAGSGRWVTISGGWYQSLTQPPWQPPPPVFGLAWTYNFVALAVVGVAMASTASSRRATAFLGVFALTVLLALAWAYLFYVPHALVWAAVSLTACAVLTLPMVALAFVERWWLGALLLPYQAWLLVAASLSWGYVRLN